MSHLLFIIDSYYVLSQILQVASIISIGNLQLYIYDTANSLLVNHVHYELFGSLTRDISQTEWFTSRVSTVFCITYEQNVIT